MGISETLKSDSTEQNIKLQTHIKGRADSSPIATTPTTRPFQTITTKMVQSPSSAPPTDSVPPKAHSEIPSTPTPKPRASVSSVTPSASPRSEVTKRPAIYPLPYRANPNAMEFKGTHPVRAFPQGPQVNNRPAPLTYKSAARRVTLAIVAMPIAIVTSWVLYDRSM